MASESDAQEFRHPPGGPGFNPPPSPSPDPDPTLSSSSTSSSSSSSSFTSTSFSSSSSALPVVSGTVSVAAASDTSAITPTAISASATSKSEFTRTDAVIILVSAISGIMFILVTFLSAWCFFKRRRRRRRAYIMGDASFGQRTTFTIEDPINLPIDLRSNVETPSTSSTRWSRYSRFSFKADPNVQLPPPALGASKMLANHSVQAIIPIMIANHPYSRQAAYEQDLTEVKSEVQKEIKRDVQRGVQTGTKREDRSETEAKRESIISTRPFSFSESVHSPVNMGSPRPSSTFSRRDIRDLQDFSYSNPSPMQSKETITLNNSANTPYPYNSSDPFQRLPVEEVVIPSSFSDDASSFRSPVSNGSTNQRFPFPLPPQNAVDRVRIGLLRTLDARKPVLVSGNRGVARSSMIPEVIRNTFSSSTSTSNFTSTPNPHSNPYLYPRIKQHQYPNPRFN